MENLNTSNTKLKQQKGREKGKTVKSMIKDNSVDKNYKKKNKPTIAGNKVTFGSRQENKNKAKNNKRK